MTLKQELVTDILTFLRESLVNGDVPSDDKESIEVAIDCIGSVFDVPSDAKGGDLFALYKQAKESFGAPTEEKAPKREPVEVSDEDKAEADTLKVEGNKLMAQSQFKEACESYTKAIEKNPNMAVYYSNRAAAYSNLGQSQLAADDARIAIELDPAYSKGYSRLGLALYALGDVKGALDAYEKGMQAEGDKVSDGMRRGYETVKRRFEELGMTKLDSGTESKEGVTSSGGGLSGLFGAFSEYMKDPQFGQMAQQLMSNPEMLQKIATHPAAQKVRESFGQGQMPNISSLINDPSIQDAVKSIVGNMGEK